MYKINKLIHIEPDERNESLTSENHAARTKNIFTFFFFYQRTEKSCMHRGSAQIAPSCLCLNLQSAQRGGERGGEREGGGSPSRWSLLSGQCHLRAAEEEEEDGEMYGFKVTAW